MLARANLSCVGTATCCGKLLYVQRISPLTKIPLNYTEELKHSNNISPKLCPNQFNN